MYLYVYLYTLAFSYICFWWLSNCYPGLLRAPKVIDTVMHCCANIIAYYMYVLSTSKETEVLTQKTPQFINPFLFFPMYLLDFVHFETDQIFFSIGSFGWGYVSNVTTEDLVRCGSIGGGGKWMRKQNGLLMPWKQWCRDTHTRGNTYIYTRFL